VHPHWEAEFTEKAIALAVTSARDVARDVQAYVLSIAAIDLAR
jgi:hypothetical protein